MTRLVTITEIEERTSQNGRRFWRVRVAGERQALFVWDPDLAEELRPGGTYEVEINGSADYPRLVSAVPVTEPSPAPPPVAGTPERRMLRMSALRAAAEILHGTGLPASEVTAYAEALLAWLEA